MKEFRGKVAVITGAASGIGRALAERCVAEGMQVVLADIEAAALAKTEHALRATGAPVLSVVTDVAQAGDMEALAQQTLAAFGAVHLLINNAGVVAGGSIWESTVADWKWVMGVNVWGVIHGLRVFVPLMLDQKTDAHIVNTASASGLISYNLSAPYHATKHAVVALSEHLYYALRQQDAKINVSVVCSAWVKTKVLNAERNRPAALQNPTRRTPIQRTHGARYGRKVRQALQTGLTPHQVAAQIFAAIMQEQFYILTHVAETAPLVRQRMESLLHQQNPPPIDIDDFLFLRTNDR